MRTGWREAGILVEGPSVRELQGYFDMLWEASDGTLVKLRSLTTRMRHVRRPARNVEWLVSGPGIGRNLYGNYLSRDLIRCSRLSLIMGYFVPTASLRRMIGRIARRGRVEMVLPQTTDVPISRLAGGSPSVACSATVVRSMSISPGSYMQN